MSNYYTPNIEEFHVGFRYEYAEWWQRDITFEDYHTRTEEARLMWEERKIRSNYTSDGFFKRTVTTDDFSELKQRGLDAQQTFEKIVAGLKTIVYDTLPSTPTVRVKYLDNDDIEELGWIRNKEDDRMYHVSFERGKCSLHFCEEDMEIVITSLHPKVKNFDKVVFFGKIKNYNELKSLMEQLEIIK